MKQLDGVEWEIENILGIKYSDEIEGPTFYVNNYRLRIYCIIARDVFDNTCSLHFYFRRIEGEFDKNLGLASITHYRIIKVNNSFRTRIEWNKFFLELFSCSFGC